MSQIRLIFVVIIGLALIVLAIQNSEAVTTKFLVFTFTTPHVVLLLVTAFAGFVVGWLSHARRR